MKIIDGFYCYLWIREKDGTFPAGTPYYVGKGKSYRASCGKHNVYPPRDKSLIQILPMVSEEEAFEYETKLIKLFGRIDNGTGCLRNRTDGGEGVSGNGRTLSNEEKAHLSSYLLEHPRKPWLGKNLSTEHKEAIRKSSVGKVRPNSGIRTKELGIKPSLDAARKGGQIAGKLNAHVRWHITRNIVSPNCLLCKEINV